MYKGFVLNKVALQKVQLLQKWQCFSGKYEKVTFLYSI